MPVRLFYIGCQTEALLWFLVLGYKRKLPQMNFNAAEAFFAKKLPLQNNMCLTVLLGGNMTHLLKRLGKIAAGRKTGDAGDFFNTVAGSDQEIFGSCNPYLCQICNWRFSIKLCKLVA